MMQGRFRASVSNDENASTTDRGAVALDLIHQAADAFRGMEQHARETEARAQSLCTSAMEKVQRAEMRAEAAERAQRTFMIDAEGKLRDAYRALEEAQSRLQAKEDHLTAIEFRAQAAEAEAREAKQALELVEEAIRRRLLCASSKVDTGLTWEVSSSLWPQEQHDAVPKSGEEAAFRPRKLEVAVEGAGQ